MPALLTRTRVGRGGIVQVPVNEIDPNPNQPRRIFDGESLAALAESIKQYGVLSPISVRLHYGRYELIAGERRLRAARLAGLTRVPCLVLDVDMEESGLLAMVENLQREDLDFVEEARGISNLIRMFDMSQEEAARRLGLSQSAVANKLRLLKLPPDILAALRDKGLTERHGRALLRLGTPEEQRAALAAICDQGLNVAQTDAYIDALLTAKKAEEKPARRRAFILKDVRVFLNTLTHSLDLMKQGGIAAGMKKPRRPSQRRRRPPSHPEWCRAWARKQTPHRQRRQAQLRAPGRPGPRQVRAPQGRPQAQPGQQALQAPWGRRRLSLPP